jgi:hypothetical protein
MRFQRVQECADHRSFVFGLGTGEDDLDVSQPNTTLLQVIMSETCRTDPNPTPA